MIYRCEKYPKGIRFADGETEEFARCFVECRKYTVDVEVTWQDGSHETGLFYLATFRGVEMKIWPSWLEPTPDVQAAFRRNSIFDAGMSLRRVAAVHEIAYHARCLYASPQFVAQRLAEQGAFA